MEQSLSSASQETPRILWNPKVHYRIYKILPDQTSQGFPIPILEVPERQI
jgi:hypothetical protein